MTSAISDVHRELIENIMRYFVTATAVILFRGEDFRAFHRVIFLLCEARQIHLQTLLITHLIKLEHRFTFDAKCKMIVFWVPSARYIVVIVIQNRNLTACRYANFEDQIIDHGQTLARQGQV